MLTQQHIFSDTDCQGINVKNTEKAIVRLKVSLMSIVLCERFVNHQPGHGRLDYHSRLWFTRTGSYCKLLQISRMKMVKVLDFSIIIAYYLFSFYIGQNGGFINTIRQSDDDNGVNINWSCKSVYNTAAII